MQNSILRLNVGATVSQVCVFTEDGFLPSKLRKREFPFQRRVSKQTQILFTQIMQTCVEKIFKSNC